MMSRKFSNLTKHIKGISTTNLEAEHGHQCHIKTRALMVAPKIPESYGGGPF